MTAVQYNTMSMELWQDIGAIAGNENLMRRLARYAKKLAKEKTKYWWLGVNALYQEITQYSN